MAGKASKPSIVIIPGSFSLASFYDPLVNGLKDNGLDTFCYGLPSASRKAPEHSATLAEDVTFFNGVLNVMCDFGRDVVVLAHSYGGCVATQCVKGLTEKRKGKGRVLGIIYMTAAVPLMGQSLGEMTADLGFQFIKMHGEFMYHDPVEESARVNFSDLPLEKGVEWVKQMPNHSAVSFAGPLEYAGYEDVDKIAYILHTKDKCLSPDFQRKMIENARSGGKPVKVYERNADHCSPVTQPEEQIRLIVDAVESLFV